MRTYIKVILVMISAAVTALSFYTAGFLAWLSVAPFFIALFYCPRLLHKLACSFLFGVIFFAAITYWFTYYTFGLWIPIVFILSIFPVAFGLAFHFICKIRWPFLQIVLALAVWMAIEFFRCRTFMAFPWGMLAYTQYAHVSLLQITKITGVYGLSAAMVLCNLCIAYTVFAWRKNRKMVFRYLALALSVAIGLVLWGSITMQAFRQDDGPEKKSLNVALVQTNVAFDEKFHEDPQVLIPQPYSPDRHFRPDTDLVVFAESVLWGSIDRGRNQKFSRWVQEAAQKEDLYFLLGQIIWDEQENYYNAAVLYSPQFEIIGRYNKIHPLPFAEYMPYPDILGFLRFLNIASQNITPDRNFDLIYYPQKGFIGTSICFESTLPIISRTFRHKGADILFVLTDTAGFRDSIASWHHVIFSAFRAVENQTYVVHSSNKGVSAVINPLGEIMLATELGTRDVFYETVYFSPKKSVYAKVGNLFLYSLFAASFLYFAAYLLVRKLAKKL